MELPSMLEEIAKRAFGVVARHNSIYVGQVTAFESVGREFVIWANALIKPENKSVREVGSNVFGDS